LVIGAGPIGVIHAMMAKMPGVAQVYINDLQQGRLEKIKNKKENSQGEWFMEKRLYNKICIVTGGGSGIGKETCIAFAEEEAKVVIVDIDDTAGNAVNIMLKNMGAESIYVHCDVTLSNEIEAMLVKVRDTFGRIDVFVNNTGIFIVGNVLDLSEESFDKVMAINAKGVFLCMKSCIPYMMKQGSGSIINIASEAGIAAIPGQVVYNVSKAAVIMLTKSTAVDYAIHNIRVNCICPGRVHTALVQRILDEAEDYQKQYKLMSEDRPMMHMGKPKDVALAAIYFASDESSYTTGSVLSVDGGYVCP